MSSSRLSSPSSMDCPHDEEQQQQPPLSTSTSVSSPSPSSSKSSSSRKARSSKIADQQHNTTSTGSGGWVGNDGDNINGAATATNSTMSSSSDGENGTDANNNNSNSITSFLSFRNVANCLTDAVHRTAVAVANEIAQLEERMIAEEEEQDVEEEDDDDDAEEEEAVAKVNHHHDDDDSNNNDRNADREPSQMVTSSSLSKPRRTSKTIKANHDNKAAATTGASTAVLSLPWEVNVAASSLSTSSSSTSTTIPIYVTDEILMKQILSLSTTEVTFRSPFALPKRSTGRSDIKGTTTSEMTVSTTSTSTATSASEKQTTTTMSSFSSSFVLDESRIKLTQRLLDIDPNLELMKQRLRIGNNKDKEIVFWKNYFYHCGEVIDAHNVTTRNRQMVLDQADTVSSSNFDIDNNKKNAITNSTISGPSQSIRKFDHAVSSLGEDDDSLIATSSAEGDFGSTLKNSLGNLDDSSYVLASAPTSANTFTTMKSVEDDDDIVFVNRDTQDG